jgi:hypothetical protein
MVSVLVQGVTGDAPVLDGKFFKFRLSAHTRFLI